MSNPSPLPTTIAVAKSLAPCQAASPDHWVQAQVTRIGGYGRVEHFSNACFLFPTSMIAALASRLRRGLGPPAGLVSPARIVTEQLPQRLRFGVLAFAFERLGEVDAGGVPTRPGR
jgi:hypothetical protein